VQPGDDPHSFSPSAKQLIEISQARTVFTLGMPFLKQLREHLEETAPGLEMINLQRDIELMTSVEECDEHEGHHHHHGEEKEDGNKESDIHTWLAPELLKKQLTLIGDELEGDTAPRTQALLERIDVIDAELAVQLAPLKGKVIYVHHPAFGYFAKHYGLEQKSAELGGREPSAKRIVELVEASKADSVQVIFTQPQFDPSSAEKIASAINGTVVSVDPLAEDILANFKTIGDAVTSSLQP